MIDITNINTFTIGRPDSWTLFGEAEDFDRLPQSHKDQIHFLDKAAGDFVNDIVVAAKLITGEARDPFKKGNFKSVERYSDFSESPESKQHLKKWLYQRGLPYSSEVFILPMFNQYPLMATWKMVIKYAHDFFHIDDALVFDRTLNWCLYYYHHDELFFGKGNVYDPTEDNKRIEELIELKKKYPKMRFPY